MERYAVEKLFSERKDFIIIGLTGRTGSGCTYVSKYLSQSFENLQPPKADSVSKKDMDCENRQYQIVYDYAKENWRPFYVIEMRHVILTFILENDLSAFTKFARKNGVVINTKEIKDEYEQMHKERLQFKEMVSARTSDGENVPGGDDIYNFYFKTVPQFYDKLKKIIDDNDYNRLFQKIGDNIRASGKALDSKFNPNNVFTLSQRVNLLIKILRRRNMKEKNGVLVVIDALRTPYEASFFKDRYSAFYLWAVACENKTRIDRLVQNRKLKYDTIQAIDRREYPSLNNTVDDFYKINVEKTIEHADIYINNNKDKDTKKQLVRYVSLIMHPGLVSPTPIERCMQIAYDAKLNSGCLSRQVGAVISNDKYNVLSIGWNSTPDNQVPCNLRNIHSIIKDDESDDIGISDYEKNDPEYIDFLKDKFQKIDLSALHGRNCSYCFKDAYNAKNNIKNQVFTRSIHAEEMAFLKAAQIGGLSVRNGYLFTTASPCELCSKKACHTGISKIYYIDKYPGISYEHILNCGENPPDMILFNGAIGRAYNQLYSQILPYKDELYMLLDFSYTDNKN